MRSIGFLLKTALCALGFLLLQGCGKDDVVPQDKMVALMADMFLADQAIDVKPDLLMQKDSMLLYPAIMQKHGISVEQYEASVKHYVDDGERYLDILKEVKKVLNAREKQLSALIKEEVAERDSRILTEWWALDSVRCMPAAELSYDKFLRSVRWMVMRDSKIGEWKFMDSAIVDIPHNATWWKYNMMPPQREYLEHFLKDIHKVDETPEEKEVINVKIKSKDEKVSRKLLNNSKRKKPGIKEGVRSFEL